MKLRALVVSHHKRFRRDLAELVEIVDCCVEVVSEGATAKETLGKINSIDPDLVLVDLSLRNVSGLELTERIHARWPDIAIVVIGNEPSNDYRAFALEAGAVEYVDVLEISTQLPEALGRIHCPGQSGDDDSTGEAPRTSPAPEVTSVRTPLRVAPTGPRHGPFTAWQYVHVAMAVALFSAAVNFQSGQDIQPLRAWILMLGVLGILCIELRQFNRARLAAIASPVRYGRGGMIGN